MHHIRNLCGCAGCNGLGVGRDGHVRGALREVALEHEEGRPYARPVLEDFARLQAGQATELLRVAQDVDLPVTRVSVRR